MTGKERITRILNRQPVDRIGLYEHFWGDTSRRWHEEGHLPEGVSPEQFFPLEIDEAWCFNITADLDFQAQVLSEDEETRLVKDGNGATLRRHKHHDTTPEHVAYDVTDFASYQKLIRPFIIDESLDERRINFDGYADTRARAAANDRFFVWSGVNVFECMHPVCGHEHMLVGMALEPEWIAMMAQDYADLHIRLFQKLFDRHGLPDGIWFYEDMGFKERPFMSPDMYCQLIQPSHKRTIDFCHNLGLKVIMHSCGFIEPLLPHMVEAGIDCLQAIEIKAGMDPLRIIKNFPGLPLMGGIDVRVLCSNDRDLIRKEFDEKFPALKANGFVLHSDHSIPANVDFDTYQFFIEEGLRRGTF